MWVPRPTPEAPLPNVDAERGAARAYFGVFDPQAALEARGLLDPPMEDVVLHFERNLYVVSVVGGSVLGMGGLQKKVTN